MIILSFVCIFLQTITIAIIYVRGYRRSVRFRKAGILSAFLVFMVILFLSLAIYGANTAFVVVVIFAQIGICIHVYHIGVGSPDATVDGRVGSP